MNIYFACSITGGRQNEDVYQQIVAALHEEEHEVPTAVLASPEVTALEAIVDAGEVYRRDVEWIAACDALVAEISTPSHGVGYEIGYALALGKPVLCLHRKGITISKMILGNPDPNLSVRAYTSAEEAVQLLREQLLHWAT
jgi:nucleoside 2-deoxyribosyltransferase